MLEIDLSIYRASVLTTSKQCSGVNNVHRNRVNAECPFLRKRELDSKREVDAYYMFATTAMNGSLK